MEHMIDEETAVHFYFCGSCGRLWEWIGLHTACKGSLFEMKKFIESSECPNCHVPSGDELLDWLADMAEEDEKE